MFEQITDLLKTIDQRVDAKVDGARQEIRREAAIDALSIVRDVVLPIIHDALTARIDQLKQQ